MSSSYGTALLDAAPGGNPLRLAALPWARLCLQVAAARPGGPGLLSVIVAQVLSTRRGCGNSVSVCRQPGAHRDHILRREWAAGRGRYGFSLADPAGRRSLCWDRNIRCNGLAQCCLSHRDRAAPGKDRRLQAVFGERCHSDPGAACLCYGMGRDRRLLRIPVRSSVNSLRLRIHQAERHSVGGGDAAALSVSSRRRRLRGSTGRNAPARRPERWSILVRYLGLCVVPGIVYFVWRWNYFGELLPLPFLVKSDAARVFGPFTAGGLHDIRLQLEWCLPLLIVVLGSGGRSRLNLQLLLGLIVVPSVFYASMRLDQNWADRFYFYFVIATADPCRPELAPHAASALGIPVFGCRHLCAVHGAILAIVRPRTLQGPRQQSCRGRPGIAG